MTEKLFEVLLYCTMCGSPGSVCDHSAGLTDGLYCYICGKEKLSCAGHGEKFDIVNVQDRPEWPITWMNVAREIARRSYDPRLKVAAIIVSEDNTSVLSIGYNGNYRGGPHSHESSEPGKSGFIHAEVNALVKCDFNFPKKKHMYVTHSPCRDCSKLIINAEISRVVYDIEYRDTSGIELLRSAGVSVMNLADAILNNGNR